MVRWVAAADCTIAPSKKKNSTSLLCLFLVFLFLSSPPSHAARLSTPRGPPSSKPHPPNPPPSPLHSSSGVLRPRRTLRLRPAQDLQPPLARVDPVVCRRLEAPGGGQAQVHGARGGSRHHRGLRPGQEGRLEEKERERERDREGTQGELPTLIFFSLFCLFTPSLPRGPFFFFRARLLLFFSFSLFFPSFSLLRLLWRDLDIEAPASFQLR